MEDPANPFAFDEPDDLSSENGRGIIEAEALHKIHQFIKERVIARHEGKLPPARTIAVRLIVLQNLIDPDPQRSLRSYAKELGCSRAWLSKVGLDFAASIGLQASWQRIAARKTYSERARGVHAGTWKATSENGKWERRKLRESRGTKDQGTSSAANCASS